MPCSYGINLTRPHHPVCSAETAPAESGDDEELSVHRPDDPGALLGDDLGALDDGLHSLPGVVDADAAVLADGGEEAAALAELGAVQLVAVTLELDPRRCGVTLGRVGVGEVGEGPDAGGAVEGGGEEDVLGQRVELEQLQAKKVNKVVCNRKYAASANLFGNIKK